MHARFGLEVIWVNLGQVQITRKLTQLKFYLHYELLLYNLNHNTIVWILLLEGVLMLPFKKNTWQLFFYNLCNYVGEHFLYGLLLSFTYVFCCQTLSISHLKSLARITQMKRIFHYNSECITVWDLYLPVVLGWRYSKMQHQPQILSCHQTALQLLLSYNWDFSQCH